MGICGVTILHRRRLSRRFPGLVIEGKLTIGWF